MQWNRLLLDSGHYDGIWKGRKDSPDETRVFPFLGCELYSFRLGCFSLKIQSFSWRVFMNRCGMLPILLALVPFNFRCAEAAFRQPVFAPNYTLSEARQGRIWQSTWNSAEVFSARTTTPHTRSKRTIRAWTELGTRFQLWKSRSWGPEGFMHMQAVGLRPVVQQVLNYAKGPFRVLLDLSGLPEACLAPPFKLCRKRESAGTVLRYRSLATRLPCVVAGPRGVLQGSPRQ